MTFSHIKKDMIDVRELKCVVIGYLEGVKGYKLWKIGPRGSRFIIRKYISFKETYMVWSERTWEI